MNPLKSFLTYLVLVSFLMSAFCTSSGIEWQYAKNYDAAGSLNVEDIEDAFDSENDQHEDVEDSKDSNNPSDRLSHQRISIIILHQMQIFLNHHPAISTPPPRA